MSSFVGGNLEQLDLLAGTYDREGQEVLRLSRSIDTSLAGTEWTGRVAEEFRLRWQDEFEPALMGLHDALVDASRVISARRAAIDQATNLQGA